MAIKKVGEVILALCVAGACAFIYREGARKVQEDPRLISWARGISSPKPQPLWGPRVKEESSTHWKNFYKMIYGNRYFQPGRHHQSQQNWLNLWRQKIR